VVRLYQFTTAGQAQLIQEHGEWGVTIHTPWLGSSVSGVGLADGTEGDGYSEDTPWLVVVEIEEACIAQCEIPRSPLFRGLLARLARGRRQREWIVPPDILNEKGRIIDVSKFSTKEPA
jgi:hypothetical protein